MLKTGDVLYAEGRTYTVLELLGRGANAAAFLAQRESGSLLSRCILKEFAPRETEHFEAGKERFLAAGKMQNRIRQLTELNNQTPPVCEIFEANGTAYIDIPCFGGKTLSALQNLTLPQYTEICRTAAKTVGYYHRAGFLCLDLKPDNLFILQNTPDDTVTQLVELIDFDSVRSAAECTEHTVFSYTREWAAPEQCNPYMRGKISRAADIYTLGEIMFYLLFGRHSEESEHRGFSEYPFGECRREFRRYTERPDVKRLFTQLFRGTLRSAAANRFPDTGGIVRLLDDLTAELNRRDYIIPKLPPVSPYFVGRETELNAVGTQLKQNRVLFVTGVGGIGKSTLIRNFAVQNQSRYDVIVYLEYDGEIRHTFADDGQLAISTVHRQDGEPADAYFSRKLSEFRRICGEKHVLFILDNYGGAVTKDLSRILDCGYNTVIVTRNQPPKNSFSFLELGAIAEKAALYHLISLNLGRQTTKEERRCFEEIIGLVQGHTLVLELIARQIAAGMISIQTALCLIRENGFSRFSAEKIGNYKDGEEVCDTLAGIISGLFDASNLETNAETVLKILALLNVRGLESELLLRFFPQITAKMLGTLSEQGWIYSADSVRLHPVIAETLRNRQWNMRDGVTVMEYHRKMIDIYEGTANGAQILLILKEAERFKEQNPLHMVKALYFEMTGKYYDTLLGGNYVPYSEAEAKMLEQMLDAEMSAISEAEQSQDSRKFAFLAKSYLSMAGILIRSVPECHAEAADYLQKADSIIQANEPEYSENRCYFFTVSAWYSTLVKPDLKRMLACMDSAGHIAEAVFQTDLERIDVVDIPKANCLFYHHEMSLAAEALQNAVNRCEKYPDSLPYIDKRAELLNCLLDVYAELQDYARCRELIAEIDRINTAYREHGIYREAASEIRERAVFRKE
ncbi:MAG: serine/threonine protein kinase [Oscillospiraceae bacterium]|nr:serine/threonine protein kinase [Oscillospiraceae bacterium]